MIQWYPGHMAKAFREMEENLKIVDLVIILLDARIPKSSYNPKIQEMVKNKPILYLFTKADKADDEVTKAYSNELAKENKLFLFIDARSAKAKKMVERACMDAAKEKIEKDLKRGMKQRPIRTMIVGIPNVGKSTLINTLCGKRVAQTGDRPGITKAKQWLRINPNLDLLDTPGVLWPKVEEKEASYNLLITGAIKDELLKDEEVALYLIDYLKVHYPDALCSRYNVSLDLSASQILDKIAGENQTRINASLILFNDFRSGALGKISLDEVSL